MISRRDIYDFTDEEIHDEDTTSNRDQQNIV